MSLLQSLPGGWLGLVVVAFQSRVDGAGLLELNLSAHGNTNGDCP